MTPHFARLNAALPEFGIKMDPKLAEQFFGSGTGTVGSRTGPPGFKGQIRGKRHLDVQNEVSHDRNRLEPFKTV